MKRTFESKKNEYRYRKETTQENLEMQVTAGDGIVAKYGDHILMADRYWNGGFIAGIYEFVETPEETGLCAQELRLLTVFSGRDFYFEYPNGDKLYSVVALYHASRVSGDLRMTDGESLALEYFALDALPRLESRAKAVLSWVSAHKDLLGVDA